MKLFKLMKDGGPESRVWGFFFIEAKRLLSVVLLRFADGSREAYHSHAFWAISWLFRGMLTEHELVSVDDRGTVLEKVREYRPSLRPIITRRDMFHKVVSTGDTLALTFRGPWALRWKEFLPEERRYQTLTHGRKIVDMLPAFMHPAESVIPVACH